MLNVRYMKMAVEELEKSSEDKCPLCNNKLYYREPAKGFVYKIFHKTPSPIHLLIQVQ